MSRPAELRVPPRPRALPILLALLALLLLPGCRQPQAPVISDAPADVAFWGDALTEGFPKPPFAADGSDSLPGAFAAHNPGSKVYNGGVSGQSTAEIAIRQGGLTLGLTVAQGVIPSSGDVAVVPVDTLGWRLDHDWSSVGTLAGVDGVLHRDRTTMRFTRAAPGAPVSAPWVQSWLSTAGAEHRDAVQVLFAGRNDIGYVSPAGDSPSRVITATEAMIDFLPEGQRALICGTMTATYEKKGTPGYDEVLLVNKRLAAQYPYSYWDLKEWTVHKAIYAVGITPTAEDLDNMAADTVPPSIMVKGDPVHYSPATAAALADEIRAQLVSRGWTT